MKRTVQITLTLLLTLAIAPSCDTLEDVDLSDEPMPIFVEPEYVDNGDGTISDTTENGIMWEKCAMGESYESGTNTCSGSAGDDTFQNGSGFCAGSTTDEYSDWRLPTLDELKTLTYDDTLYSWFKNYDTLQGLFWWSSSSEGSVFYYTLQLSNIEKKPVKKDITNPLSKAYTRCARSIHP